MKERALLVAVQFESLPREAPLADLAAELTELSRSAGLEATETILVRQKSPTAALFVGSGKAEELRLLAKEHKIQVVVLGEDLSPSQQRNLEEALGVKTIDRTQLILDIFASRARSNEGKLQVELAQLKYVFPRLAGKGIYLSRLGGGVGTRGPGEQKLEVDRRRIRTRITRLQKELETLKKRRLASIQKKKEKDIPLIALVGYTNAGKSSLFNALTKSVALVKNQLFSTLDTTTRPILLPGHVKALLVDTVGFVRDLPHHLIESFKATLEEAVHADVLLHVMDVSRHDKVALSKAVNHVLSSLGIQEKKTIWVLNKADLIDSQTRENIKSHSEWKQGILVSAKKGEGLDALGHALVQHLAASHFRRELFIPSDRLSVLNLVYQETEVLEREDRADGVRLVVNLSLKTEEILDRKLK